MVIKYRLTNNSTNITTSAPFASTVASGHTGATASDGGSANTTYPATLIADGKWHYFVVAPTDGNKTFVANGDGTYSWAFFRIKLGNGFAANDGTCYLDIDEIAFADNAEVAELYAFEDNAPLIPSFTINHDPVHNTLTVYRSQQPPMRPE